MALNGVVLLLYAMAAVLISSLDIYIPISPQLAEVFSVSEGVMKLTFLVGPLGSGLTGIPVGYLSDRYGRRPLLLLGFLFYITGTSLCASSGSITCFFMGRIIQSMGVGGLLVLASTILSDLFTGLVLARYMGLYALLFPLAFATAPLVGAHVYCWFGWQANFLTLLLCFAPTALMLAIFLPETRKVQNKGAILPLLKKLSASKWVMSLALTHAVPITVCAIFTVNGAFLYYNLFNFDPVSFSVVQAVPVTIQCFGTLIYRRVVREVGLMRSLDMGSWVAGIYSMMCLLMIFEVFRGPWATVAIVCVFTLGITFIITSAATLLLDSTDNNKGLTASFLNLVRNMIISIVVSVASFLPNDSVAPIFSAMLLISLTTLVLIAIVRQELKNREALAFAQVPAPVADT